MGGGLAGLSLALQLKGAFPDLDILVLERTPHPLPAAAHKVGESTVEIGAHYFDTTLGLKQHLDSCHIRKFGLRFLFSDGRRDIENVTEIGARRFFAVPSYQIDRGVFENFLGEEARRRGIEFRDGAKVTNIEIASGGEHTVAYTDDHGDHRVATRWLFDASGRAALIKRRLQLAENNAHQANAVWFRIDDRIDIDEFSDDPAWRSRCAPNHRWQSTNHFMGPGYWAWLIPLGSGAHSVGIVADANMHALEDMKDFPRAVAWLRQRQPLLADALEARSDRLMDFRFLRNYSHGCAQVFAAERWAMTGESGVFLDPFYSPGSDFIAIANTYITALVGHDLAGDALAPRAQLYQQLYFSFYQSTLALFENQYPLFGNARVMTAKVAWDYAYYWGVLCQLVLQDKLTNLELLGNIRPELERARQLNVEVQKALHHWPDDDDRAMAPDMVDQGQIDWLVELNRSLLDKLPDNAAVASRIQKNVELLERLAAEITDRASASTPAHQVTASLLAELE